MKIINKENLEKELFDGAVICMKDSIEKRYYRINNSNLEYSDDNEKWTVSNLTIDDLKQNSFVKIN